MPIASTKSETWNNNLRQILGVKPQLVTTLSTSWAEQAAEPGTLAGVTGEFAMGMCFCQTGPYKEHFVCFHCRKMFKKPSFAEIHPSQRPATYAEYLPQCPECGKSMHNMGKEFEPPRRSDLRAW